MKHRIVFAMIMGGITTGIVTFTVISVNIGFVPVFLSIWIKSWLLAYIVAIPAILIISPKVQLLVNYLLREETCITKEE
ncbi:MAG: hypothetical protein JWQ09_4644 [Segetibacter sp.]|nr:hypothetical protein [Segetibacter sp.]